MFTNSNVPKRGKNKLLIALGCSLFLSTNIHAQSSGEELVYSFGHIGIGIGGLGLAYSIGYTSGPREQSFVQFQLLSTKQIVGSLPDTKADKNAFAAVSIQAHRVFNSVIPLASLSIGAGPSLVFHQQSGSWTGGKGVIGFAFSAQVFGRPPEMGGAGFSFQFFGNINRITPIVGFLACITVGDIGGDN